VVHGNLLQPELPVGYPHISLELLAGKHQLCLLDHDRDERRLRGTVRVQRRCLVGARRALSELNGSP
jgi:hypothetical protein